MTRVLEICEPPDGGAAVNATDLALGTSRRGFEVEYAGPRVARPYDQLEAAGIPVHRLALEPSFFNSHADASALRSIRRILRAGDFDLIHLHSSKAGVLGRLAAARTEVPVVYSPHSFPFVGDLPRPRIALALAIERRLARLTDSILCVCDWELRLAQSKKIAPRGDLVRVYNGVQPPPAGVTPAARLADWEGEGPIIGAVAVLRRQKRLDLLIRATPAILAQRPDARVAIVGSGPERTELEALVRELGLDREARFRMIPFETSSWEYLAGLDVYVLPSAWEAFPIGVLEALAAGVPQVATDVGGTNEAVVDGRTGLLVRPRDHRALAEAVVRILEDEKARQRMKTESIKHHRENFLVESMVDHTVELYRSLAR